MGPEHIPPPIREEDFTAGGLKPLSYSAEGIAEALSKHLSRGVMQSGGIAEWGESITEIQQNALSRMHSEGSWNLGKPANMPDLQKFFEIFNGVFFNGCLTGYCQLEFLSAENFERKFGHQQGKIPAGYCQRKYSRGYTKRGRPKVAAVISIKDVDYSATARLTTRGAQIQNYLETLLHEMLHAMFFVFTCLCQYGCHQKAEKVGSHHPSWQAAANCLEVSTTSRRGIFVLCLKLDRELSMADDMYRGFSLPSEVVLRQVNLDIVVILEHLREIRKPSLSQHWVEERRLAAPKQFLKANSCIRDEWVVDSGNRIHVDKQEKRKRMKLREKKYFNSLGNKSVQVLKEWQMKMAYEIEERHVLTFDSDDEHCYGL